MKKAIKVILTDDHEVLIDGLMALLGPEEDIEVVGKALDGQQLLTMLKNKPVDLIIMDIDMPEMDGVTATREIKKQYPAIKILVLTMHGTADFVKNLLRKGADGYILKHTPKKDLLKAIRDVASGRMYYSADIASEVMSSLQGEEPIEKEAIALSKREKEIIRLVSKGLTSREIGEQLFISYHTVERHRKNILAKLDLKNVASLVRYAFENGLSD